MIRFGKFIDLGKDCRPTKVDRFGELSTLAARLPTKPAGGIVPVAWNLRNMQTRTVPTDTHSGGLAGARAYFTAFPP